MEKLKNNWLRAILFTILGLGISFGTNASIDNKDPKTAKKEVRNINETKILTPEWYVYTGPPMSSTDPLNPYAPLNAANYTPTGSPTAPSCGGDEQVCAIKLLPGPDPNHPDQTELSAISSEINSKTPITNVLQFKERE